MSILGFDEALLRQRSGLATAQEIAQQPATLRATAALVAAERESLDAFLAPLLGREDLRVVLTGAGTSAFIGQCLAPWLSPRLGCRIEAIATTDITCAPHLYLDADCPTLLVSFARSGDSPESVAAVDLAERMVRECHHLTITCNADGKLARRMRDVASGRTLCLPEATHDRGFAMTSSFTAMTLAAWSLLGGGAETQAVERIAASVEHVVGEVRPQVAALADQGFDRVVYLGSHVLKGIACEAALKLLELTDGSVVAMHDTPLGFRHGPKTFVTPDTLAVLFLSNDPHSRRYDLDLARELVADGRARQVLLVDAQSNDIDGAIGVRLAGLDASTDIELLFANIVVAQLLAFSMSLAHGLTPDQPSRSGTVNRVVQGVRIHAAA